MSAISLCFAVHEPYYLRRYTIFDVNESSIYEDDDRTCNHLLYLAQNCYLPMTELLYRQIKQHGDAFRFSLSLSGTAIDLFEQYTPEVMDSLKALAETGCVEFVTEPDSHSLAFLYSTEEFIAQIQHHRQRLQKTFGSTSTTFRHPELLFNNDLARLLVQNGMKTVLAEGSRQTLGWRNTNYVYASHAAPDLNVLLRNARLSADISQRFTQTDWSEWPLTAEKFALWCARNAHADCINIFTDFHVFGLRNPKESGIFEFMKALPQAILAHDDLRFLTPQEISSNYTARDSLDVPQYVSWRDEGVDIRGWLGNEMQKDAISTLYSLTERVHAVNDPDLYHVFERLQTSDHFHYMSTRWFSESQPDRPNPFNSPYDAYISYMNILEDFTSRLKAKENASAASATEVVEELRPTKDETTPEPAKETPPQPAPVAHDAPADAQVAPKTAEEPAKDTKKTRKTTTRKPTTRKATTQRAKKKK